MKKKVGILLDEEIIRHAKRRAALTHYLSDKVPDPKKREKAYQLFCEWPIRISKNQFKKIMEDDAWNS